MTYHNTNDIKCCEVNEVRVCQRERKISESRQQQQPILFIWQVSLLLWVKGKYELNYYRGYILSINILIRKLWLERYTGEETDWKSNRKKNDKHKK
jgi:hypothetical protein